MKKIILPLTILLATIAQVAKADDFMDTGVPSKAITAGVRFGITSSGQKMDLDSYSDNVSVNQGAGWTIGGVVDLNIREFFSIQPGFFFENRRYDYTVIRHDNTSQTLENEIGNTRYNMFTIPVLASFRFNLSAHVQWHVDAGPYFGFALGDGSDDVEHIKMSVGPDDASRFYNYEELHRDFYGGDKWQHKSFDWGLKIGTGIRINKHYSFNIYYMNGFKDISADRDWTMKNRSWNFSIGYDF